MSNSASQAEGKESEVKGFTLKELKTLLEGEEDKDEKVEEQLAVVNGYIETTNSNWSEGKYYLGGQLPLPLEHKITKNDIAEVRRIDRERQRSYGGPVNSMEAASMARSKKALQIIEDLITKYSDNAVFIGGRKRRRKSHKKRRKSRKKRKLRKKRKTRKKRKSRKRRRR